MVLINGEMLPYTTTTPNEPTQGINLPSLKKELSDISAFQISVSLQNHTFMVFLLTLQRTSPNFPKILPFSLFTCEYETLNFSLFRRHQKSARKSLNFDMKQLKMLTF